MKTTPVIFSILFIAAASLWTGCTTTEYVRREVTAAGVTNMISFKHRRPPLSKSGINDVRVSTDENGQPNLHMSGYQNDQDALAGLLKAVAESAARGGASAALPGP
jgi:hypothetical protein